jgi:hypothetical protein
MFEIAILLPSSMRGDMAVVTKFMYVCNILSGASIVYLSRNMAQD